MFLIISIVFSVVFVRFYSDKVAPVILKYSETEIKRLMFLVINKSVGEVIKEFDSNDLFDVKYNGEGEVVLVDFDSKKSSIVLGNITNLIEYYLKGIKDGDVDVVKEYYDDYEINLLKKGIIEEIPFGIVFNSSYLNNIGPKIPVRISFTRDIETGFSTDVVEYGINNALLKLNVNITMNVRVILPIISDNVKTNFTVPITMKVIQGKIPNYYMDGFTTNSNIVRDS